jgi:hypothetical protein
MKKRPVNKMLKKGCFFVPAHPYRHDIYVCVNSTCEDAVRKIDSGEKEYIEFLKYHKKRFDLVLSEKQKAYAIQKQDSGDTMIILGEPTDDWEYWEVLMHEIHHIVFYLTESKNLDGEMEAQAYLQEYLFRVIRRKLCGIKEYK